LRTRFDDALRVELTLYSIVAELLAFTKKIGCNLDVAKNISNSPAPASSRTFLWVAIACAVLALPIHGYLLGEHFGLKFGTATGSSICDINATFNCSAVAASKFSEFLGVPMALWGFSANLVLLFLLLWFPLTDSEKKAASVRNLLIASGFIALTSVVMGVISFAFIGKLCAFCMAAYALSFIGFGALLALSRREKQPKTTSTGFKFGDLTPLLVLGIGAFLASFIARDQVAKSYGSAQMEPVVKQYVQEWLSNPQRTITTIDPIATGPAPQDAKMTIVEFADFRCIHCKHAAPVFKAFAAAHPDVRFEFQVFALDGECNSKISSANGASCLLGRIAWCAEKRNGQGMAAHEYIYSQELFPTLESVNQAVPAIAKAAGMTAEAMNECTASEEAKSAIRKQADLGVELGVQGTPAIFANGKQLPGGQVLPVLQEAYKTLK
jgi:protein-disulfide isomerase